MNRIIVCGSRTFTDYNKLCNKDANPIIIAFWDGQSKGTKHMIEIATKANATVHVIQYDNN